jgi:hypothetical protein
MSCTELSIATIYPKGSLVHAISQKTDGNKKETREVSSEPQKSFNFDDLWFILHLNSQVQVSLNEDCKRRLLDENVTFNP